MKTILFTGDSLTDAVRNRENDHFLGQGYVTMTAGEIGVNYPGKFRFLNRGIGGDRTVDLLARWKKDCINLKPDYLTLLIGVNDVSHELAYQNGVSAELFEKLYRELLDMAIKENPDIKIIIMTPFIMHGELTDCYFEPFYKELLNREKIIISIAEKYGFPYINLRELTAEKCLPYAPDSYWSRDGMHPDVSGHMIIAKRLTEELIKLIEE
ncbi:MAG: GDSL family lipase [Clostridia bacterium]|nr:GDSL family lipase [Clostridia bacterium]